MTNHLLLSSRLVTDYTERIKQCTFEIAQLKQSFEGLSAEECKGVNVVIHKFKTERAALKLRLKKKAKGWKR